MLKDINLKISTILKSVLAYMETKYNKNVLKHSIRFYLYITMILIFILFSYYFSEATLSSIAKLARILQQYFTALWCSRFRFDSKLPGLALGKRDGTSDLLSFLSCALLKYRNITKNREGNHKLVCKWYQMSLKNVSNSSQTNPSLTFIS